MGVTYSQHKSHKILVDYLQIPTLEEARAYFGPLSDVEREWRSIHSFGPLIASPRARLGIGEHDGGEAFTFGGHPYPKEDQLSLDRHFPLNVKEVTVSDLRIDDDEFCDFSAAANEFPWDVPDGDEVYLKLRIGNLSFGANSTLAFRGNVSVVICDNVSALRESKKPSLRILLRDNGLPVARRRHQPSLSKEQRHGRNGNDGTNATEPGYAQGPFGLHVVGQGSIAGATAGEAGANGVHGQTGDNGGMLYLTDMRFGRIECPERSIIVDAKAGNGFPGSDGGSGGSGGAGGNGAKGLFCEGDPSRGSSKGAPGGAGGDGGNGGRGGSGGLSCDVYLSIAAGCKKHFQFNMFDAVGGAGGAPGDAGTGGIGGLNGGDTGSRAPNGPAGASGKSGIKGKDRKAPQVVVFERP